MNTKQIHSVLRQAGFQSRANLKSRAASGYSLTVVSDKVLIGYASQFASKTEAAIQQILEALTAAGINATRKGCAVVIEAN